MPRPPSSEVSQLLQAWNEGDETALEKLMPLAYKELHRMARYYMARESPGHTLQTTALVNEAHGGDEKDDSFLENPAMEPPKAWPTKLRQRLRISSLS